MPDAQDPVDEPLVGGVRDAVEDDPARAWRQLVAPDPEDEPEMDATVDSDAGDAVARLAVAVRVAEAGSPAQPSRLTAATS